MPFCPKCRSEFRPGFTRCGECEADLIEALPELPKPPPVSDPSFHVVYRTTDLVEAETIKILLEGSGIGAEVQNRYAGFSAIEMPTSAAPFLITVPASDAPVAARILQETQGIRSRLPAGNRALWRVAALIIVGGTILLFALEGLLHLLRRG